MTEHKLYSLIYILITWIITFVLSKKVGKMSNISLLQKNNNNQVVVVLMFFLIVFIGLRPWGVGGDTGSYASRYLEYANGINEYVHEGDWLFSYYMYSCSQTIPVSFFFLSISFLYIYLIYIACRRLLYRNATNMMLMALGIFSFFAFGTNGMRNGLSCSLMICAMSFLLGKRNDKIIFAILCFIAFGCHKSIALPIAAMLFSYFVPKPKIMFYSWCVFLILSVVLGDAFSSYLSLLGFDSRMENYLSAETYTDGGMLESKGFRWDFLMYSVMPILLGWYVVFKRHMYDKTYLLLLGTYVYSNAFWLLVIRSPFSNRFAYLSWCLYGLVLAYPIFKFEIWEYQGRNVRMIMIAHVSFTFFMWYFTGI